MDWILASKSPRRREILSRSGHSFSVAVSNADEHFDRTETKERIAIEIAERKAKAVSESHPTALVIGADTAVWLGKRMLGKPNSRQEALGMLRALRGRDHEVVTGVAVAARGRMYTGTETSVVHITDWTDGEVEQYVDECKPFDKAGSYGIQEISPNKISFVGDYDNIVGLPLRLTLDLIARAEETNDG